MMRDRDVLEIVHRLDALIGHQTRDHGDLDLVIPLSESDAARRALTALGFGLVEDEPTLCFEASEAGGRRVDVHTVAFDGGGGALRRQEDGTLWRYPPEGFSGLGRVAGVEVACLSAQARVLCHLNYEPDETDRRDMELLAQSRGITLPRPYGP